MPLDFTALANAVACLDEGLARYRMTPPTHISATG